MKPFLLQVAEHIEKNYSSDLQNICIVVPGRRSIVFLKKHLASVHQKTFFAPAFFAIEDFFAHITGMQIAKQEEQLLLLYQIHLSLRAEKQQLEQPFLHEFSGQAQLMLNDFNELDATLADTDALFSSLYSIKELSFFGKQEHELTAFQRNYLNFFKELKNYYQQFTQILLQQNKGYQGLIYRKAAENIAHHIEKLPYSTYLFAGFNALTKAEEITLEYLLKNKKLDYLIDADAFYFQQEMHEAGYFMRKLQKSVFKGKALPFTGNYFAEIPKKIHLIGLPQSVMQAKYLNKILEDIQLTNKELGDTAIVPADESLLLPILHAVDTANANITMGYPIKRTILYQLLSDILLALDNKNKFNRKNQQEESIRLYYKDLYAFFNNPYIRDLANIEGDFNLDIPLKLQKNAKLFYSVKEYEQLTDALRPEIKKLFFDLFFDDAITLNTCRNIQNLLVEIQKQGRLNNTECETIYLLYNYIGDLQKESFLWASTDSTALRFLFENYISAISMSFQSEATEGLQILGLLETRTLDFKNVILLSVNEGILPAGKTVNSFIPHDVKQHFGLQTYKGKDAVFSYHFYRLLQRAENVYILYSLDAKNGNVEKSRFVYQLKNELKTYKNSEITDEIIAYPPVKMEREMPVSIKKTAEMLLKLKNQSYSASSICTYLECRLRFYFRYVLELEENTVFSLDDMLQGKTIGTVIHAVLETAVENGHFKRMDKAEIEQLVAERMCGEELNLTKEDLLYEKNHLVFQIIIKYIDAYLKLAQSFEENIVIKNTEEKLEQKLPLDNIFVKLKGIIDRIDSQNGMSRIIDYKTGNIRDTELKIRDIEHAFDGDHSKVFQLLFYAYLYGKQHKTDFLEAEIVSFRKIRTRYLLSINKEERISAADLTDFESLLTDTIRSILHAETPFTATDAVERCGYCLYKGICIS